MKKGKQKGAPDSGFGAREFVCRNCKSQFSVDWETIFAIQESTHGYVGFEYSDYYIECPKCGHSVQDDNDWSAPELF